MDTIDSNKGQELIELIVAFLEQEGFEPELLKTRPACKVQYTYNSVQYNCYIMVEHDISMIRFYFIPPVTIQPEFLLPTAEYITRANCKMMFGNFELDFSDGEITYKKIMTWQESPVQMNEIMATLKSGVSVWSMYLPSLMSVLDHGTSPEAAINSL